MSISSFLNDLKMRGVEIELLEERLVCRAPKGTLTPELADRLRELKPEIIEFLQEGLVERLNIASAPIVPVPRDEFMPLSFSQERLWYLNQVEGNPAVYNMPFCLQMRGPLRVDILQRCLDELEARHETLRTAIAVRDGSPLQRIQLPRTMPINRIDLRSDKESELSTVLQHEAMLPFDLAEGPLVRAVLVQTAEEEHYILVVMHHVMSDGLSTQILLRELIALYEAYCQDQPSPLEALPVQFADYASWQRDWLQGEALDLQLDYWKETLSGELPILDIAGDYPRPPVRSSNGSKEPLRLPKDLIDQLLAIGRPEGATTYLVLLALFKTLLHRYCGQDDLIVGTPVSNRTRRESEGIIGFIANTLVLRTHFDGNPTFRQLVGRVQKVFVGAFRRQDMPFQKLVEELRPERDLSRPPIFQAFFTFQEITSQPSRMGDLELAPIVAGSTVSRMDLCLFSRELKDEIRGSLEYNTDLYSRETILRMIEHFVKLAESAAREPDKPVAELDMLTDAECAQLVEWNVTELPVSRSTVHELFESQVRERPETVAVLAGGESLTYRELDHKACQLACALQARGVGKNDLVGLCVDRSTDMVVGLIGVLKTGAAYVPMDPDFPKNRLAFMLEDAQIRTVVSRRSLQGSLPPTTASILCIDDDEVKSADVDNFVTGHATPESRAYVIFTSGSTGKPKGVEVRHSNVVNFLKAMGQRPGLDADDVMLAVTTLSFDIAVLELFLPLVTGARVVVATREEAMNGNRLGQMLIETGATVMQATPATWRMLLEAGWSGKSDLKALCGGEALPSDLARRVTPVVGELWNMYGPTETTVWSTCTQITDAEADITIGVPVANTMIRIVDRQNQQVPVGVPGEICIGGAGVARGYLGRSELTKERFIIDPTRQSRERFYRTGDLGRWRRDGNIECLGRLDNQVKIQGFRIELGEIETVMLELEEISEAVVVTQRNSEIDAKLVAYVVYMPGRQLTTSEVRRHLRESLPAYMVPGLVVELEALPRTPNGKIDRRSLPDPLVAGQPAGQEFVAPVTEEEKIVAQAWETLLPVEQVGRHDNFFELGGHSLLSMRAVAAIEKRTGHRLDPRLMFFQTVEQIAQQLPSAIARPAV